MRIRFLPFFLCLVLLSAQAAGQAAAQTSWTGDADLDAAFAHNNAGRYEEAFALFSKLYKRGVPMAGTMVGRYYEDGRAVPQDQRKAMTLYTEARSRGDALGAYHYVRVSSDGWTRITSKELERLVATLTPEAEAGNAPVQTVLAATYLFLSGAGPELSRWTPPEARGLAKEWMLKAAEAGYAPAQSNMTIFYTDDAQEWLEKAAAAGYPPALRQLGR